MKNKAIIYINDTILMIKQSPELFSDGIDLDLIDDLNFIKELVKKM